MNNIGTVWIASTCCSRHRWHAGEYCVCVRVSYSFFMTHLLYMYVCSANLVSRMLEFKKLIDTKKLEPHRIQGTVPLCM